MRKGQAAMEFLMTYGWAILVVLAAIGALAYFGVLSPDRFLPDKCTANPPFSCGEYKVSTANGLSVAIKNNAGVDMTILSVALKCTGSAAGLASTVTNVNVSNDNNQAFTWTAANVVDSNTGCVATALKEGSKFKAEYIITYQKDTETTTHTGSGSIQGRVEA